MRVGISGNVEEAKTWLGKAQQELFRLKQRMALRGDTQGSFGPFQLSPTAWCSGYVLPNGIEAVYIRAEPVGVPEEPPVEQEEDEGVTFFEFQTSGKPVVTQAITVNGLSFTAYKVAVVGTTDVDKTIMLQGARRADNASEISLIARPSQVQLADEPVTYLGTKAPYSTAVYETFAPLHSHTGVLIRAWNYGGIQTRSVANRGPMTAHSTRDYFFDVPFQTNEGTNDVVTAYVRDSADWPRASGIQTVTHALYGTRTFAIYIDTFSQVFAFPIDKIGPHPGGDPWAQNVNAMYIQMDVAALPVWAYQPTQFFSTFIATHTIDEAVLGFPDIDWKVHPDGTKMVAIVWERAATNRDATYFDTDYGAVHIDDTAFNDFRDIRTGALNRQRGQYNYSTLPQRYTMAPGVIEATIAITLTGANPEDFTIDVTVSTIRRPTTSQYCAMLAGYVWYDIKAEDSTVENPKYLAKRGDLVSLDIERYWNTTNGDALTFFSLKNLRTDVEIRDIPGEHIIDYDWPTMSFVVGVKYDEIVNRTVVARSNTSGVANVTVPYTIRHFGVAIFINGKHQQTLCPDTMDNGNRLLVQAAALVRPRALVDGMTYMPLNDLRTWNSDATLTNLRDHDSTVIHLYKSGAGLTYTTPSASIRAWWDKAMQTFLPLTALFWTDTPNFGWYLYADEIMNKLWVTADSTFFVHPNGSYAFFDQQHIYNKHGMYLVKNELTAQGTGQHEFLQPFLDESDPLEHVIFDCVHLIRDTDIIDTTFIDLYNQAVGNTRTSETFETITKADMRATITNEIEGIPGFYGGASEIPNILRLKVEWFGQTFYYYEPGYQGGLWDHLGDPAGIGIPDAGGLVDLTLGGGLSLTTGLYTAELQSPFTTVYPIKFSTCAMLS